MSGSNCDLCFAIHANNCCTLLGLHSLPTWYPSSLQCIFGLSIFFLSLLKCYLLRSMSMVVQTSMIVFDAMRLHVDAGGLMEMIVCSYLACSCVQDPEYDKALHGLSKRLSCLVSRVFCLSSLLSSSASFSRRRRCRPPPLLFLLLCLLPLFLLLLLFLLLFQLLLLLLLPVPPCFRSLHHVVGRKTCVEVVRPSALMWAAANVDDDCSVVRPGAASCGPQGLMRNLWHITKSLAVDGRLAWWLQGNSRLCRPRT